MSKYKFNVELDLEIDLKSDEKKFKNYLYFWLLNNANEHLEDFLKEYEATLINYRIENKGGYKNDTTSL